jgi:hypothetical protein
VPNCERASLTPTNAGECDVEIDLNDGSVTTRSFTFEAYSSCCGNGFSIVGGGHGLIDLIPVTDANADGPGG